MTPSMGADEQDLHLFRTYVANSEWRFARTYVESYPHEYTLQRSGDRDAFATAILCIERLGVIESFWETKRRYLYVDDRKYWHMGDAVSPNPKERPTLINRTWVDVTKYRPDAKALGYDDARLDQLAKTWKALLQRARNGT